VKILRGPWNDLFRVLGGLPDLAHDDKVDACSEALEMLNPEMKGYGAFEAARQRAEELLAEQQRNKPQPTQPTWAPGSMEWLAEKNKSSSTTAPAPNTANHGGTGDDLAFLERDSGIPIQGFPPPRSNPAPPRSPKSTPTASAPMSPPYCVG
jgi:hypothetical protein